MKGTRFLCLLLAATISLGLWGTLPVLAASKGLDREHVSLGEDFLLVQNFQITLP